MRANFENSSTIRRAGRSGARSRRRIARGPRAGRPPGRTVPHPFGGELDRGERVLHPGYALRHVAPGRHALGDDEVIAVVEGEDVALEVALARLAGGGAGESGRRVPGEPDLRLGDRGLAAGSSRAGRRIARCAGLAQDASGVEVGAGRVAAVVSMIDVPASAQPKTPAVTPFSTESNRPAAALGLDIGLDQGVALALDLVPSKSRARAGRSRRPRVVGDAGRKPPSPTRAAAAAAGRRGQRRTRGPSRWR